MDAGEVYNPLEGSGLKGSGSRREQPMADPVSVLKDFDAAWNAHDIEGVLAFFTDDAVVRMEPPPSDEFGGVYTGKEQIRAGWVEPLMPGFHVESRDHQVAGHQEGVGDRVIWTAMVSGDFFRQMGAESPVVSPAEAVIQGDKIKFFTGTNAPLPEEAPSRS
jgi:ketosteroid isomerase-like protein